MASEILGGNGILLDYHVVRHMADMEALYTFEGTAEIQTLIVGRDITGVEPLRRTRVNPDIRTVDVDGLRIRVAVRGDGECPLLLIMGIGGNLDMWSPFERPMRRRGVATIAYDAPGTGGSLPYPFPKRVRGLTATVEHLLDALGHDEVDVLGVSFGGGIAQQLAHQAPQRVRRLVLAATAPGLGGVPGHPRALIALATPRRYINPAYLARVSGRVYCGRARRGAGLTANSAERFAKPPSVSGYLAQMYVDPRLVQPAVAAPDPAPHTRAGR